MTGTRGVLLFLLLLSTGAAAQERATDLRAAFASGKPFVVVALNEEHFREPMGEDMTTIRGDISNAIEDFFAHPGKRIALVFTSVPIYREVVKAPVPGGTCVVLFVRGKRQGLVVPGACGCWPRNTRSARIGRAARATSCPKVRDASPSCCVRRPPRPWRTGRFPG